MLSRKTIRNKAIAKSEGWVHKEGKHKGLVDSAMVNSQLGITQNHIRDLQNAFEDTTAEIKEEIVRGNI